MTGVDSGADPRVAALARELDEAREAQKATADVLKIISRSGFDLKSVLETLTRSSAELCGADEAIIFLRSGEEYHAHATFGADAALLEYLKANPRRRGQKSVVPRVIETGAIVHIPDKLLDADYAFPGATQFSDTRAMLGVPMIRDGQIEGVFVVSRYEAGPFSDRRIALLQTFADQAMIAIENARLFATVEKRTAELNEALQQQTATADVLKVISRSAFDLDAVLTTLIGSAIQLCEATRGVVWLMRDGQMYLAAHVNYPDDWVSFAQGLRITPAADAVTISGLAAFTGEVLNVEDVLTDMRFRSLAGHQLGNYRGGLGVPLKRNGEVIGTISLSRPEARLFTERQIALVQTFADQAVIAIENARLFEEVQARTRDLEESLQQQTATANVLKAITRSAFDLNTVLTTLVQSAMDLCSAARGMIFLRDSDGFRAEAMAPSWPELLEYHHEHPLHAGRDATVPRVVLSGGVEQIPDILADPEYHYPGPDEFSANRAYLGVPLMRDGQVDGVFILSRPAPGAFSERQVALVQTFADQAVIAIENARLFSELEARNREILSRYFSPNLAQRFATAGVDEIELSGQRREVAALFTDLEGFTSIAEAMEPSMLSEVLNGYIEGMTSVVFSYEGTLAKIVGDALHVLFGAPGDQPDHAARAVACALDLDQFAQSFRKSWLEKGIKLGPTRIGVNAGPAIVGNFGGGRFFDYTAYGDTINTAARLETANKQLGTRVCVSESVASQVPNFRGRPVGDLILRGKTEPLRAFEPLPPDDYDESFMEGYLRAFAKLEAADPAAIGAFAAEVGKAPNDRLASFHLKRLLNGATGIRINMD